MLKLILDANLMLIVNQHLEVMQRTLEVKCQILEVVNCKEKIF